MKNTLKMTQYYSTFSSLTALFIFFLPFLTPSCCGSFTEAVRLSAPRMHQALHRPQLATETRQSSFGQRPSGERGQGNDSSYILTCCTLKKTLITSLITNIFNKTSMCFLKICEIRSGAKARL